MTRWFFYRVGLQGIWIRKERGHNQQHRNEEGLGRRRPSYLILTLVLVKNCWIFTVQKKGVPRTENQASWLILHVKSVSHTTRSKINFLRSIWGNLRWGNQHKKHRKSPETSRMLLWTNCIDMIVQTMGISPKNQSILFVVWPRIYPGISAHIFFIEWSF